MNIPEFIISKYINIFQDELKANIEENVADPTKDLVHNIFDTTNNNFDDFSPTREATKIFSKTRPIKIKVGYNIDVGNKIDNPIIHIGLPQETQITDLLGSSPDLGYIQDGDGDEEKNSNYFKSDVIILIVSNNADSNFIVYNIIKYMLLRYKAYMEAIDDVIISKIYGSELSNLNTPSMPPNIFARTLTLGFQTNVVTSNVTKIQYGSSFDVDRTQIKVD